MRIALALLVAAVAASPAGAAPRAGAATTFHLRATLTPNPAVIATGAGKDGHGLLTATVSIPKETITWRLTYAGMTGPVIATHIHVGQPEGQEQGVLIGLCEPCRPGAHATQPLGFGPSAVISMLRRNETYVNLHTKRWQYGELRGVLKLVK
jgi:hypothetical protein